LVPGESTCGSCFEGYALIGKECVPNRCRCDHGDPAVGKACPAPGAYSCSACDEGYRHKLQPSQHGQNKLKLTCIPNVCSCQKHDGTKVGEPAFGDKTSPPCLSEGENVCISCLKGYHMQGDHCLLNECRCHGGTPVSSESCTHHGATNCTSCHAGYWLAVDSNFEVVPGTEQHKPDETSWDRGAKVCIEDAATTRKPFDCLAALDNWEQAWSGKKKSWCCEHEDRGCIADSTGHQMCEGKGYDFQQCGMVGCCEFDMENMECRSAIEDQACFPEFSIRSHDGLCVGVDSDAPSTEEHGGLLAKLLKCDPADSRQVWRPASNKQIGSPTGFCLEVPDPQAANTLLRVSRCAMQIETPVKQQLEYVQGQLKVGNTNLCLTSKDSPSVTAVQCDQFALKQKWAVPEVQDA